MIKEEQRHDIICFADAPWKYPLWTNKQRIMTRLARRGHRIIYVDPPLGLVGWFKWWRAGRRGLGDLIHWTYSPQENLIVYSPVLFPPRYAWGRRLDEIWRRRGVRRLARRLDFADIVAWVYHPDAVSMLSGLDRRFLVYDCVDQYCSFPAYTSINRQREIIERETKLLKAANAVITTSKPLYEQKAVINTSTFLVENVGDFDHFRRAASQELEVSELVKSFKRPRLGFLGALDDYKVDFVLLSAIADARPEWSIVLVGPIAEGGQAAGASKLLSRKNVHFIGAQPYQELPAIMKGFDVAIITYRINDYTNYCFPLKVYEFMAAGIPIVSTPLPALASMTESIKLADTPDEFIAAIEEVLLYDLSENRSRRIEEASRHTYESRAQAIIDIIDAKWKADR